MYHLKFFLLTYKFLCINPILGYTRFCKALSVFDPVGLPLLFVKDVITFFSIFTSYKVKFCHFFWRNEKKKQMSFTFFSRQEIKWGHYMQFRKHSLYILTVGAHSVLPLSGGPRVSFLAKIRFFMCLSVWQALDCSSSDSSAEWYMSICSVCISCTLMASGSKLA